MTHGSMRVLPIEAMRDAPMWLCGFAMKICLANCAMIIRFILMRVQRIVGQFFGMSRIAKSLKGRLAYLIRLILFVAVAMPKIAEPPVRMILLPRDARTRDIIICG